MILVDIMMMTTFARCMDTRKRLSSHDSEVIIVMMLTMMLMLLLLFTARNFEFKMCAKINL